MVHPHAIVSGGSSGIGLALSERLAAAGWNVTILSRDREKLDAARARIEAKRRNQSQRAYAAMADVSDEAAVQTALNAAVDTLGAPELVVANAGIVITGLFTEVGADAFRRTMDVNYFGVLNVVRAVLPGMRARRKGRVVVVSSGAGLIGLYGYRTYAPSKFAVRGLAEVLRAELKPDGIAVSVVYPPDTDTPQLHEEIRTRPTATSRIAGGAKMHSASSVAEAIMRGIAKDRFVIAPGWEMGALAKLHSLAAPVLNRFWFDPVVKRWHGVGPKDAP